MVSGDERYAKHTVFPTSNTQEKGIVCLRKSSDVVTDFSVSLKTPKGPGGLGGGKIRLFFYWPLFEVFGDIDTEVPETVCQKT